jgi:hypothetical protein
VAIRLAMSLSIEQIRKWRGFLGTSEAVEEVLRRLTRHPEDSFEEDWLRL